MALARALDSSTRVRLPTRRRVARGLAAVGVSAFAGASRAFGLEPSFRLEVVTYRLTLPGWCAAPLRIVALADLHACEPWMPAERIAGIVARANTLAPDIVLLLGDYAAALHRFRQVELPPELWAAELAGLDAPLGVHAVLGNHDFWEAGGPAPIRAALTAAGIRVYENDVARLDGFWLAGTGSMMARPLGGDRYQGADDLPGTLAQVNDSAPVLLMAHEPDMFPRTPRQVALTLSGHTHGGQVRLPGIGPLGGSGLHGQRYAYGLVEEGGRKLVVSGGLGCSVLPVRFGMPPEVTVIEVTGA
jgi:predicted MPP superfamily phosphohydrolase